MVFGLIVVGAHVNSTHSGLSVPDYPTTYGWGMFAFPISMWKGGILWEHGHRLLASTVGALVLALLVWVFRISDKSELPRDKSLWLKVGISIVTVIVMSALAGVFTLPGSSMIVFMALCTVLLGWTLFQLFVADTFEKRRLYLVSSMFFLVCLQGAFGGLTVRLQLPTWTSATHGMLAELFFAMSIGTTFLLSKSQSEAPMEKSSSLSISFSWLVVILTFVQVFFGALTRHTYSGLAIPTFPLNPDGSFFPNWSVAEIVIHFVHRTFAYVLTVAIIVNAFKILNSKSGRTVKMGVITSVFCVALQILLGASVVLTQRNEIVATLHVAVGAAILGLNVFIALAVARRSVESLESVARSASSVFSARTI